MKLSIIGKILDTIEKNAMISAEITIIARRCAQCVGDEGSAKMEGKYTEIITDAAAPL